MYNGVMRALMPSGLADTTRVPVYVLNVTYPLLNSEIIRFCSGTCVRLGFRPGCWASGCCPLRANIMSTWGKKACAGS